MMALFCFPYLRIEIPPHYLHIYTNIISLSLSLYIYGEDSFLRTNCFPTSENTEWPILPIITQVVLLNHYTVFFDKKSKLFWLQSNSLTSQRNEGWPISLTFYNLTKMHPNVISSFLYHPKCFLPITIFLLIEPLNFIDEVT